MARLLRQARLVPLVMSARSSRINPCVHTVLVDHFPAERHENSDCRIRRIGHISLMGELSRPAYCGFGAKPQLLNEYSDHEVNIYEKDARLGGHTNTVEFKRKLTRMCEGLS